MKRILVGGLLVLILSSLLVIYLNISVNEEDIIKAESSLDGEVIEVTDDNTRIHFTVNDPTMYSSNKFVYFVDEGDTNQYEVGQQIQIDLVTYESGMIRIMESNPPQLEIERIKIK